MSDTEKVRSILGFDVRNPPFAVFVPVVGQYENIGDVILRRELVNWLQAAGELHVFVGRSPSGYDRGLDLPPSAHLYRSFAAWYLAALRRALRGSAHYAFKPGEIQLSLPGLKEHVIVLPLLALIRLGKGKIVRVGSGARDANGKFRPFILPSVCMSHLVRWRDTDTAYFFGRGTPMPDLAFAQGAPTATAFAPRARPKIVISMRGDHAFPDDDWFTTVRVTGQRLGLDLCVVSQVERDSDRSREISERLGAELLEWDGSDHDAAETRLRQVYARTELVISDRLHVCIAALTEGAVPACLSRGGSAKIDRHFSTAGLGAIAVDLDRNSSSSASDALLSLIGRRREIPAQLASARDTLNVVKTETLEVLAGNCARQASG